MSTWAPKRFWKETRVEATDGGFQVVLDGRPVRTPAKAPLVLPTRALAEALAVEWDAQEELVTPALMPMTRSANSAIDKVTAQRVEVADMLAAYGDSDLLCYRAEGPDGLVARQAAAWDPLLDWAEGALGARLLPRTGIVHEPQDAAALAALSDRVHALGPFELAGFHDLVAISGSLVIGFAAFERAFDIETLWDASRVDETWQADQWGEDEEATEHAAHKKEGFLDAARFCMLLSITG